MRTTIEIDDGLIAKVRRKAGERKTTVSKIVEQALRCYLIQLPKRSRPVGPRWIVVAGTRQPDVNIADRDQLYDMLENRQW